ncbi:MAG TPA: hypothetical protein VFD59_17920 [Nocardioidaceae bacterium]|nr:hypothetical protein [Nocardioidaceae bacterium]
MTWDTFHRRGEVLRAVLDEADARQDGTIAMEVPGVADTFGDELTLIAALQLRWHTQLAGTIEYELMEQPLDLESAVISAWCRTATELSGIRAIIDTYTDAPTWELMAHALTKARRKDWALMAAMAGKAGIADRGAAAVGRAVEERARHAHRPTVSVRGRPRESGERSLLDRFKAHLAA